jgi:hypothetical protein
MTSEAVRAPVTAVPEAEPPQAVSIHADSIREHNRIGLFPLMVPPFLDKKIDKNA